MGDIGKISNLRTEPCALTFRDEIDEGKLALLKLRRKNKKIGDISGHEELRIKKYYVIWVPRPHKPSLLLLSLLLLKLG